MLKKVLPGLTLLLALLAACGTEEDDELGMCQDDCSTSDDCASGYMCAAVGSITNRICVPEECDQCIGKACAVTPPQDGECAFQACI